MNPTTNTSNDPMNEEIEKYINQFVDRFDHKEARKAITTLFVKARIDELEEYDKSPHDWFYYEKNRIAELQAQLTPKGEDV